MQDLIERLEKVVAPDRELDRLIWDATNGRGGVDEWTVGQIDAPAYTASIDAALTLVPDGLNYVLKARNPGAKSEARVGGLQGGFYIKDGEHSCPAIALCIAALKARAAISAEQ